MKRYDCIKALARLIGEDTIVVSCVGNTTPMWLTVRPSDANVYPANLGSCTGIGLGLALALPHRKVVALDADGNLLLNLGALTDVANENPSNLAIIVFDNQTYESGGNIDTATAKRTDLAAVALGAGIQDSRTVRDLAEFEEAANEMLTKGQLCFLVAKVERDGGAFEPPGYYNPVENKFRFVKYIERTEGVKILPWPRGSRILLD